MEHLEQSHEEEVPKPKHSVVSVIWNIMFALFYPILAAFSIVIMVVMFITSGLSTLLIKVARLFTRQ